MDLKNLINKLDTISSKKILLESTDTDVKLETEIQSVKKENKNVPSMSNKLIESFGYIAELSQDELAKKIKDQPAMSYAAKNLAGDNTTAGDTTANPTGYDPKKVQYSYQDGKANPDWPGNKPPEDQKDTPTDQTNPTDQNKPKPKPGMVGNPGTRAYQHWLNQNGYKVAIDGKFGPEMKKVTSDIVNNRLAKATAGKVETGKYAPGEEEFMKAWQDMNGVGSAYNVKPGGNNMSLNSPSYLQVMKKYGFDPKTGNPISGSKTTAAPGQGTQPTDPNAATSGGTDAKSKASAISKAISGAGTDEQAVYGVLDTIKNAEEFNQVAASYKTLWGGSRELGQELAGDFSGYDLVMLNQRLMKIGLILNTQGQIVPRKAAAESVELDTIKFLSGLK